jgi:hypothetical protein
LFNAFCDGKPISLEAASVELFAGPEKVKEFSITGCGTWSLRYSLLVDTSGSTRVIAETFIKQSAPRLVQALESLNSDGYFATFTDKVVVDNEHIEPKRVARLINEARMYGTSALYDALLASIEELPRRFPAAKQQRYAVFVLTDADDNASSTSLREVVDGSRKRGIAIYPIILADSGNKKLKKSREALLRAAAATGGAGLLLTDTEDFSKKVTEYLRAQQILTFKSDPRREGLVITSSKCDKLKLALISVGP